MTSVDVPNIGSEDPLRLTFCPKCDYSLIGLPLEGTCPECGYQYDQAFVILRGIPKADQNRALMIGQFRNWSVLLLLPLVIFLAWSDRNSFLNFPLMWFLFGYFALLAVVGGISRLNSPRPGQVLVWLSPMGARQQDDVDPVSLTSLVGRYLPWIYLTGLFFCMFFPVARNSRIAEMIAVCIVALVAIIIAALEVRRRPSLLLEKTLPSPRLIPWQQLRKIRLRHSKADRFHLSALNKSWLKRMYSIDLEFVSPSKEFVKALRQRICQWSGREIDY